LGQKLLEAERSEEATELFDLAWRLNERVPWVLAVLVKLLNSQRRERDALDRCREAALSWMLADMPEGVIFAVTLAGTCGEPETDHILYSCLEGCLRGAKLPGRPTRSASPYRIGYVLCGENQPSSTLPFIFSRIAMAHDRSAFEPVFFSALHRDSTPDGDSHPAIAQLRAAGFDIHYNLGKDEGLLASSISLAKTIHAQEVDVVVFQSQAPNYFVSALLRPAPIVLGFDHGNPHVYVSTALDHAVSAVPRFAVEHSVDSICLPPCFLNQEITDTAPISRESIDVPKEAPLIVTSGLPTKFDARISGVSQFFGEMNQLLLRNPTAHWCIVGVTRDDIPRLMEKLDPGCAARLRCVGMTPDITPYLKAATVYLDTFPISGGLTVHHAMRLGIPTFTYQFAFRKKFNKLSEYSVVGDFIPRGSVLLVDENPQAICEKVQQLLSSAVLREIHSMEAVAVAKSLSDGQSFVATFESKLSDLIRAKSEKFQVERPVVEPARHSTIESLERPSI